MNKTTLVAIAAFAALLGVVLYMEYGQQEEAPQSYEIPGFLDDPELATKSTSEVDTKAFERIEIEGPKGRVVLTQTDGTWKLSEPREATVEQFRVNAMLLQLQTPTSSLFSKKAPEDDLGLYGLDEAQAIRVKVTRKGQEFAHFILGLSEKSEDPEAGPDEVDTWLARPDDDWIYRMAGKDLRTPFDRSASDLRDKKIFAWEAEDVAHIELVDPTNAEIPRIALRNETPEAKEGADKPKDAWVIEEPKGYSAGTGIKSLATSLAGFRVAEFLASPPETKPGLDDADDPFRATVTLRDGKKIEIRIGADAGGDQNYAKLAGDDEIYKVTKFTADALRKKIGDLRDKKALGVTADQLTAVSLPSAAITLAKGPDGAWQVTTPPGVTPSQKAIEDFLRDIETWTVSEFLPKEDLAQYGLAPADSPTTIQIAAGPRQLQLTLSAERDNTHYATVEGTNEVYKLTTYMAKKFLGKTPDDFRNRDVFAFDRELIAKVELIHPTQTVVLERKPDADPSQPGDEGKWRVKRDEDVLDTPKIQPVQTVISSLANVQVKTFTPDATPDAAGLAGTEVFKARVTLTDGTTHELEISDATYQDENYARTTTEPAWAGQIFSINPFQAKNIRQKYKDFR
jgi:hypothetical protein